MELRNRIRLAFAIMGFLANISPVHASLIWSWKINDPIQTVLPADIVQFHATIFNDPTSTETINGWSGAGLQPISFLELAISPYDIYTDDDGPLGPATSISQFNGVSIAPGQNFDFILYSLIPPANGAPLGTYESQVNVMSVNYGAAGSDAGMVHINVVPIPSAMLLLLSGLGVLVNALWPRGGIIVTT